MRPKSLRDGCQFAGCCPYAYAIVARRMHVKIYEFTSPSIAALQVLHTRWADSTSSGASACCRCISIFAFNRHISSDAVCKLAFILPNWSALRAICKFHQCGRRKLPLLGNGVEPKPLRWHANGCSQAACSLL